MTSFTRPIVVRLLHTRGQPWVAIRDAIVSDKASSAGAKALALLKELIYFFMRLPTGYPQGHVVVMKEKEGEPKNFMGQGQDNDGKPIWMLYRFKYVAYPVAGKPHNVKTPEQIQQLFGEIQAQFRQAVFNQQTGQADCWPIVFVNPTYEAMGLDDYKAGLLNDAKQKEHLRKIVRQVLSDFLSTLGKLEYGQESKLADQMFAKAAESGKFDNEQLVDYVREIVEELARFLVEKSVFEEGGDVWMVPPTSERKASELPPKHAEVTKPLPEVPKPLFKAPEKAIKPKVAEKTEKKKETKPRTKAEQGAVHCFICMKVMGECNCGSMSVTQLRAPRFTRSFQD